MRMNPPPSAAEAPPRRQRILFVAEAVTLAHVARPLVLAKALDPARYEVHFACDPRYNHLLGELPFALRPIRSIPSAQFLAALARGRPVYDTQTLRAYVAADRQLLAETRPDAVVGDFRLSLSVSARLAGVPYLTITNAYWSPYARRRFPLPELPLTRYVGLGVARVLFRLVRPLAFALHCRPLNRVRREHGLPSLGSNLCRVYTDADYTLYADVPELVPTENLPPNHQYLGPILWSPAVQPPAWWDALPTDRPIVYVNLGSSGQGRILPVVLEALAELPVTAIAATAGRVAVGPLPAYTFVADYLPGEEAAARASVVICNGGSPTTQQALAAGTPVVGIASNMDQYMNMEGICDIGGGKLLRAGTANRIVVRDSVTQMLEQPAFVQAASSLARVTARNRATDRFQILLTRAIT